MELRSETKYITRILDKISETLEENKQINIHLVKVTQKTDYHENRLIELEKKCNNINNEMLKVCPSHNQKLIALERRVEEVEQDLAVLDDTIKADFRFRDKMIIAFVTPVLLQFLALVIYMIFKR